MPLGPVHAEKRSDRSCQIGKIDIYRRNYVPSVRLNRTNSCLGAGRRGPPGRPRSSRARSRPRPATAVHDGSLCLNSTKIMPTMTESAGDRPRPRRIFRKARLRDRDGPFPFTGSRCRSTAAGRLSQDGQVIAPQTFQRHRMDLHGVAGKNSVLQRSVGRA